MISPSNHIFIQLISNKEFVLWVNHPNEDREYFWHNWSQSNSGVQQEILRAREFIQRLQFKEEFLSTDELDMLLGKVLESDAPYNKNNDSRDNHIVRVLHKQWMRVAGILLVTFLTVVSLGGIYPSIEDEPTVVELPIKTVTNPRGVKSKLVLSDGSTVHLNYESSLTFPQHFTEAERKVVLKGEAFFDVAHVDSVPFVVMADGVAIKVLGTSFNVSASNYQTQVSLVQGKVLVNFLDQQVGLGNQMLTPGNQILLDRRLGKYSVSPFQSDRIIGWKDGVMVYQDASMTEFLERLEKWYGVNIQVFGKPSKPWKINGRYENELLEDILLGLKFVYNIDYQINEKNVWIKIKD